MISMVISTNSNNKKDYLLLWHNLPIKEIKYIDISINKIPVSI